MRRILRRLIPGLAGVLVLALLLAAGIALALWRTLPPRRATAALPGLSAPVAVSFDRHGIPRIRAANFTDAMEALGYLHARDRMFQMELMRRAAAGRLAALAGSAALPLDREMRTLGLGRLARGDAAALDPPTRAVFAAYARGVNAYIAARGRFAAPQYLWFGPPAPWRVSDSLLWPRTMGLWLSMNWRQELARLRLAGRVPAARLLALWPGQGESGAPDAALARHYAALPPGAIARALPAFPAPFTQPARASNAWAVDGAHSATGAPLLAGDPHLGFGFPSLWYLVRIDTPRETLVGASAPGVPGVILGRNRHIAWSFTSTGADVQDIFVETPSGPDAYMTPDGPRPFTIRTARIAVRGGKPEILRVRATRHGPVISDLFDPHGPILAVAMANLLRGRHAAEGLLALDRAGSVAAAGRAASRITAPVQNLIVAGRHHIGLFVTGRVPIRRAGDGAMPVEGADGAHDWIGWAGGTALPHSVDPASGRLINANNRVAPRGFPVFLGRDWFSPWRARRIRALLARRDRATLSGFAAIQRDTTSLFARALLPRLLALPPPPGIAGAALRLLRGWDGAMRMDAPQPLIFQAGIDRFYALAMRRAGIGRRDLAAVAPEAEALPALLAPEGAAGCGQDCVGLERASLTQATAALAARFGPDPSRWRWGRAHGAVFADPLLAGIPLGGRFATWSIPAPGRATTIDAAATA
ncbi:MAG: penicillin acylase family protein, partial [Rhodospirillales bacterium]|nr:penicillin acylase family protein [Rhodospirillales bacterium]